MLTFLIERVYALQFQNFTRLIDFFYYWFRYQMGQTLRDEDVCICMYKHTMILKILIRQ